MIAAFPGDPKTAPSSYRYFIDIVARLQNVTPVDLTENSVLIGSSAQITDTLNKVEAAGFDEVILYINVGLKPHAKVKDEMACFIAEGAQLCGSPVTNAGEGWDRAPPSSAFPIPQDSPKLTGSRPALGRSGSRANI